MNKSEQNRKSIKHYKYKEMEIKIRAGLLKHF